MYEVRNIEIQNYREKNLVFGMFRTFCSFLNLYLQNFQNFKNANSIGPN